MILDDKVFFSAVLGVLTRQNQFAFILWKDSKFQIEVIGLLAGSQNYWMVLECIFRGRCSCLFLTTLGSLNVNSFLTSVKGWTIIFLMNCSGQVFGAKILFNFCSAKSCKNFFPLVQDNFFLRRNFYLEIAQHSIKNVKVHLWMTLAGRNSRPRRKKKIIVSQTVSAFICTASTGTGNEGRKLSWKHK